jgi:hypothetical protein
MMMEFSKKLLLPLLAVLALGIAGCPIQAGDQIPCVEDVTCPAQYPVCGPTGKCIAGTSGARASVAIVGADGYAPTDLLSGTVRMLVVARAATGVATVRLASGTTNFAASSAAAAPPLFAFDVDTTAFPDGDVPVSATVVAGDASTGTANGVLHVDNALPPVSARITAFSVGTSQAASTGSANISSGGTTKLWASFTGRGNSAATLSCAPACNSTLSATSIANGGNVTVTGSADGAFTYTLTVTPSAGPSVTSNLTINVVPPANAISLTTTPSVIHQGGSATLTPTFNFGSSPAVPGTATIVGTDGSMYSNLVTGIGVQVAPTVPTTTYSLQVSNAAGAPAASVPTATVSAASGTWSPLNNITFDVLRGATVTALDNGKVLIAGGMDGTTPNPVPAQTARLCDATGACVSRTMGTPRAFHTAVKVGSGPNAGKVLLTGGYTTAGPATPTNSAEFYDPGADAFANTTAITTGTVTAARARHIAVLFSTTTILIAGGTNGTTNLNTAVKYDISTATPTTANVSNTMAQPRASFTATLLGSGSVLIVGGKTGTLLADRTAELFDPTTGSGTFIDTGALLSGEDKRSHTAVLIGGASTNSGKVLISGGVNGAGNGTPSSTQFLYTPGSGTFASVAAMATARSNHAAISLSTDSVLICGGTDGTSDLNSCERYDPASGTQYPTAPLMEARTDFELAPITISSLVEILAAGGTVSTPTRAFAETYNPN